jgi:hypothetical protein
MNTFCLGRSAGGLVAGGVEGLLCRSGVSLAIGWCGVSGFFVLQYGQILLYVSNCRPHAWHCIDMVP